MMNWQEADLVDLVAGEQLGAGAYRKTYVFRHDPTCVIKRSTRDHHGHNILEYHFWDAIQSDKELSKWFAPCVRISDLGLWLIQKRTEIISKEQLPKKVPYILTDLKRENWGLYEGRPVCHDYGNIIIRAATAAGKRMRVANWFDPGDYA